MKQINNTKRTVGFTIIELMVVMVIVGLLVTMAMPSFTSLNRGSQLTATSNELIGAFNRARNEAIRRGQAVTVSAEGNNWQKGYTIWVDLNLNGSMDVSKDEKNELLFKQTSFGSDITVVGAAIVVSFIPNGFSESQDKDGATVITGASIAICPVGEQGAKGKSVVVLISGRTKVVENACS
jgi:type IV fimbrial biogenesis protein FimT